MVDFLSTLATRTLGLMPVVQPMIGSIFSFPSFIDNNYESLEMEGQIVVNSLPNVVTPLSYESDSSNSLLPITILSSSELPEEFESNIEVTNYQNNYLNKVAEPTSTILGVDELSIPQQKFGHLQFESVPEIVNPEHTTLVNSGKSYQEEDLVIADDHKSLTTQVAPLVNQIFPVSPVENVQSQVTNLSELSVNFPLEPTYGVQTSLTNSINPEITPLSSPLASYGVRTNLALPHTRITPLSLPLPRGKIESEQTSKIPSLVNQVVPVGQGKNISQSVTNLSKLSVNSFPEPNIKTLPLVTQVFSVSPVENIQPQLTNLPESSVKFLLGKNLKTLPLFNQVLPVNQIENIPQSRNNLLEPSVNSSPQQNIKTPLLANQVFPMSELENIQPQILTQSNLESDSPIPQSRNNLLEPSVNSSPQQNIKTPLLANQVFPMSELENIQPQILTQSNLESDSPIPQSRNNLLEPSVNYPPQQNIKTPLLSNQVFPMSEVENIQPQILTQSNLESNFPQQLQDHSPTRSITLIPPVNPHQQNRHYANDMQIILAKPLVNQHLVKSISKIDLDQAENSLTSASFYQQTALTVKPIVKPKQLSIYPQITEKLNDKKSNRSQSEIIADPSSTPTIQVTIGRIEIRMNDKPLTPKTPTKPTAKESGLSLQNYLKQRQGVKND